MIVKRREKEESKNRGKGRRSLFFILHLKLKSSVIKVFSSPNLNFCVRRQRFKLMKLNQTDALKELIVW